MKIQINDFIEAGWYKINMKNVCIGDEGNLEIYVNPGYFIEDSYDIMKFFQSGDGKELEDLYNKSLRENSIQDFLHFIICVAEYSPESNYGGSDEKFKCAFDILLKCKIIELLENK